YNFVELQLVNKNNSKKKILTYIIILALLFTAGVYRHLNDKLTSIQKTFDKDQITKCHFDINENNDFDYKTFYSKICNVGDLKQKNSYFVFGDSHAYQLSHLINDVFSDLNIKSYFIFKNGCPPLIISRKENENIDSVKLKSKNCLKLNHAIYEHIRANDIKNIVLIARWNFFTSEGYNKNRKTSKYFGNNLDLAENQKLLERLLKMTIDEYTKLGININIIADIPELKDHPYNIYSDAYKNRDIINFLDNSRINIEEFNESYKFILNLMDDLNKKNEIKVFFPHNTLCKSNKCVIGEIDKPFYKDENHISFEGSKLLKSDLTNFFFKEIQ
ncbi:SGNH hydrolase domain-containing protein, partial [Candidatus Pelagibacter sp. HIMB1521]|uniref:SGNH hydrolase domain-containing protein n=1 Tax=Candidatus Pelagibacter sp. HIMB1521 TaxID=3413344 RepID=UPI003F82D9D9